MPVKPSKVIKLRLPITKSDVHPGNLSVFFLCGWRGGGGGERGGGGGGVGMKNKPKLSGFGVPGRLPRPSVNIVFIKCGMISFVSGGG